MPILAVCEHCGRVEEGQYQASLWHVPREWTVFVWEPNGPPHIVCSPYCLRAVVNDSAYLDALTAVCGVSTSHE